MRQLTIAGLVFWRQSAGRGRDVRRMALPRRPATHGRHALAAELPGPFEMPRQACHRMRERVLGRFRGNNDSAVVCRLMVASGVFSGFRREHLVSEILVKMMCVRGLCFLNLKLVKSCPSAVWIFDDISLCCHIYSRRCRVLPLTSCSSCPTSPFIASPIKTHLHTYDLRQSSRTR
jgi:hypothetical protein